MKIRIACLDNDLLWVIDDIIGGLYCINQITLETKCAIDFWSMFQFGKFDIQSLFKWQEDYIVIVPLDIGKSWILYNKITGEIAYRKVMEQKYRERLIAIDPKKRQLYFFPLYNNEPLFIVDRDTLKASQTIENWCGKISSEGYETAWTGAYDGKYIFYPKKNTKTLVRMECGSHKIELLDIAISVNLIDVDYAFEELWVLPVNGNELYQVDKQGLIVNTVELSLGSEENFVPCFARIIVQKKYLFLLPCYRTGIYVYEKQTGKTFIISEKCFDLYEKENEVYLRYWEYYVRDNKICFLPFLDKYLEIDLDNLTYTEKELLYPDSWRDEEEMGRCICSNISGEDSILREAIDCDFKVFIKFIQYRTNNGKLSKKEYVDKKIWNILTNVSA